MCALGKRAYRGCARRASTGLCAGRDGLRSGSGDPDLLILQSAFTGLCAGCDVLRTCSRSGDRELQMLVRGFKPRLRGLRAGWEVLRTGQDPAILTYRLRTTKMRGFKPRLRGCRVVRGLGGFKNPCAILRRGMGGTGSQVARRQCRSPSNRRSWRLIHRCGSGRRGVARR